MGNCCSTGGKFQSREMSTSTGPPDGVESWVTNMALCPQDTMNAVDLVLSPQRDREQDRDIRHTDVD